LRRGFTLIELLICLALAGLIAAVALPSWRALMLRTQRADATTALYALASAQERYRLVHGRYADQAAPAPPVGLGLGQSARGWYELRIAQADATRFTATARAAAGSRQAADTTCRVLSINETGARGSTPGAPETCWR
jgi:type IV pilus assembly protein PilE